jgi:hypothetical protein
LIASQLGKFIFTPFPYKFVFMNDRPHTRPNCHVIYGVALDTLPWQMCKLHEELIAGSSVNIDGCGKTDS